MRPESPQRLLHYASEVFVALAQGAQGAFNVDHDVLHQACRLLQQESKGVGFSAATVGLHNEPRLDEGGQIQRDSITQRNVDGRCSAYARISQPHVPHSLRCRGSGGASL